MMTSGASQCIHARGFLRPRLRVELANACSGLNGHPRHQGANHAAERNAVRRPYASHFRTEGACNPIAPQWSTPFVAQVLGQSPLTKNADRHAARDAYARAAGRAVPPRLLKVT